jgi:hypothetical protein
MNNSDTNKSENNKSETIIISNNIDYNKDLNYLCKCGIGLPWKKCGNIMLYPCEHMIHKDCYYKYNQKNKNKPDVCPLCGTIVLKIFTLNDKNLHFQRYADLLSMSCFDDLSDNTPTNFIDSIFDLASILARIPFMKDTNDSKSICHKVFSLNNLELKVIGMNKLQKEDKKVFIANHVSHLEFVIIYYLLQTGFLASSIVGKSKLVDQFRKIVPLLTFHRGDKNKKISVVDKIKEFVNKHKSICLFPEGLMHHPDTLTKFRTGAFHTGLPIYTITIKHNDIISDGYLNQFLYKLGAKKNMEIEVHIDGPYYPPFSNDDIQNIRMNMAIKGDMVLSRVSNRDIKDKGRKVVL